MTKSNPVEPVFGAEAGERRIRNVAAAIPDRIIRKAKKADK
jgi:hypothetical protein